MGQEPKKLIQEETYEQSVETLSMFNVIQLVFFCCKKSGELAIKAMTGIWNALLWSLRIICMGFFSFLRILFHIPLFVIDKIAHILSWCLVGIFSLLFRVLYLIFSSAWNMIRLTVMIPFYCIRYLFKGIRYCVKRLGDVCGDVHLFLLRIPSAAHEHIEDTRQSFALPQNFTAKLGLFVAMMIIAVLPFSAMHSFQLLSVVRADTESATLDALSSLEEGRSALTAQNYTHAEEIFTHAEKQFSQAQDDLSRIPSPVRTATRLIPPVGQKVHDGENLIQIGLDMSRAGVIIAHLASLTSAQQLNTETLVPLLSAHSQEFDTIIQSLQESDRLASEIDTTDIPAEYHDRFTKLTSELHSTALIANQLQPVVQLAIQALGAKEKRRYLVVFQNNAELRPTGGFIGSYALVDVLKGKITKTEIPGGGSYDLQGALSEHVLAPFALHIVNPTWQFQDANWFADFPTSAKNLAWFYEKSSGPTVDGVIAINALLFKKILAIFGPIEMTDYGKNITADNFMRETQKQVELDYDKTVNKPKQFIADLFPRTLEKMQGGSPQERSALLSTLVEALTGKDIQIFFQNNDEEKMVRQLGVAGEIKSAPLDYFLMNEANVAGGKSDTVIDEHVTRETVFRADGHIEVHVTIHKKNNGNPNDPFTGKQNVSYIRFYTPRGTTVISTDGFRAPDPTLFKQPPEGYHEDELLQQTEGSPILDPLTNVITSKEFDKSVFAQWIMLEPGHEVTASISFLLPFSIDDIPTDHFGQRVYTALIQRQSGSPVHSLDLVFTNDGQRQFIGSNPAMEQGDHSLHTTITDFNSDKAIGITLK